MRKGRADPRASETAELASTHNRGDTDRAGTSESD